MKLRDMKPVRRLKDRSGESLAEVLVAVLIAAVALVTLASMIMSSSNLITKSKNRIENYVGADKALVEQSGDSGLSGTVSVKVGGYAVKLTDDDSASIEVVYYKNAETPSQNVVSYRVK